MTRRVRVGLLAAGIFLFFGTIYLCFTGRAAIPISSTTPGAPGQPFGGTITSLGLTSSILTGGAIAPKLENATARQELGRASWKLMHTMMARFPEAPTPDDSLALQTYIQLFARLYPCGDCASHFQLLLQEFPPQTSSRNAAAGWACFVHNEVNKRLKKELFDCTKIGDFYDCGCGEDNKADKMSHSRKITALQSGYDGDNTEVLDEFGATVRTDSAPQLPAKVAKAMGSEASIELKKEEG
ncbi:hypothetical protein SEPCBS57363_003404 [Sporothrix epigloea]|uniref:Sulfhydryl oxidase n=1 Tax=Sporothrix epigloea TaxID=1892477 RepID=A0ABP0DLA3_9PEZI